MSRRTAAALAARIAAAAGQPTAGGALGSWLALPQACPAAASVGPPTASLHARWQLQPCRPFGSSSAPCFALGIVEQLRDSRAPAAVEAAAAARSQRWEVVQFDADGGAAETETSPEALGLHPRDVYLFDADAGTGAQGAMLAPRARAFLFRTDACRAVVFADRAVLWPGQRKAETVKIAQAIKDFVSVQSPLPFELRALEALLSETVKGYATSARRLAIVAETVLADMGAGEQTSTGELQRLIPIERQLTHMQNEVNNITQAIAEVGNSEAYTRMLCLTQRAAAAQAKAGGGGGMRGVRGGAAGPGQEAEDGSDHSELASAMLKAYEAKLHNTQMVLREALGSIEQMRASWHMALDHQRNRVLRVDLFVGVVSLCAVISSMPAAYAGMNLVSGLEETPGLFWPVVQGSLAFGATLAACMWAYYRVGPKWRYARRMKDIDSLRDLLVHHLDELGDIMQAAKRQLRAASAPSMSKAQFSELVQSTVRGKPMTSREVDLLYRVLDADSDGLLELSDMERLESRIHLEAMERSTPSMQR